MFFNRRINKLPDEYEGSCWQAAERWLSWPGMSDSQMFTLKGKNKRKELPPSSIPFYFPRRLDLLNLNRSSVAERVPKPATTALRAPPPYILLHRAPKTACNTLPMLETISFGRRDQSLLQLRAQNQT